ncbi:MAG: hypothetical protein WD904_08195 [Dehalococcoidia bacterium]
MMRWMGKRLVLVLGLLAVAALLLAACGGGDDDDDAGDDGGATATETGATDDSGDDGGDASGDGSGDDGGDDSGSDFDACTLLTQDEVERVIGPADEGLNQNFDPIFSCLWSADAGGMDYLSVGVFAGSDQELGAFFELTEDGEEIQGLGEGAQFSESFGTLEVLVDGYYVTVNVSMFEREPDEVRDITTGLAERVLGRLP